MEGAYTPVVGRSPFLLFFHPPLKGFKATARSYGIHLANRETRRKPRFLHWRNREYASRHPYNQDGRLEAQFRPEGGWTIEQVEVGS